MTRALSISCSVSLFPSFPENYVLWHILELVRSGQNVDILADRYLPENSHLQPEVDENQLLQRVVGHSRSSSASKLPKRAQDLASVLKAFSSAPLSSARAVRSSFEGNGAGVLQALRHIAKQPQTHSYDASHAYFALPARRLQILRDAKVIKGPMVVSFLGYDITSMPSYTPLDYYRPMFDRAEILAVSSDYMSVQLQKLGVPENRITKLPLGLPARYFQYVPRQIDEHNRLEIITAARLVEVKGLDVGLRALALVKQSGIDFHWHIFGDGELRKELEVLRNTLGLQTDVTFHGFKPLQTIQETMKTAHLAFYPGKRSSLGAEEAVGGSILEAQASGIPVITTTSGGMREALSEGISGFVGESENFEHLAELIKHYASIPEKWTDMGAAGRSFIEATWDSETLNTKWLKLYKSLA